MSDTIIRNPIVTFTAVTSPYVNLLIQEIDYYIKEGYTIEILTDQPHRFEGRSVNVTVYSDRIFNYFDKFLFLLRKIEEHQRPGFLIDTSKLYRRLPLVLQSKLFKETPVFLRTLRTIEREELPPHIYRYIKTLNFPTENKIEHLFEGFVYFPVLKELKEIIKELEKLKIVFSYHSLLDRERPLYIARYGNEENLGYVEGIGVSILLNLFNIEHTTAKKYEKSSFTRIV